jgi:hypothetical protein
MERRPLTRQNVARHVRRAVRPGSGSARLLGDLSGICWPGGTEDRIEPLALSWFSLAEPELLPVETPVCRCGQGVCQICN